MGNFLQPNLIILPCLDLTKIENSKKLPSEALIFYSGIFWSAPDKNFGGYFHETDP
jgi:hypothetical protein